MTLWSQRFGEETDARLRRLGDSFPFDRELLPYEISASLAHARALTGAGVLDEEERDRLCRALEAIRDEGTPEADAGHEDVHSFVEAELEKRIGGLAGKLHTARSRNDQVATLYRLWLRDRIDGDEEALREVLSVLVARAKEHPDAVLPAYTHLQRAQPVLLAHHLLAHGEALLRDRERLLQARRRTNVLPLGSGAGTGVGFPLDRDAVARELGFDAVSHNSLDAVSDRDFLGDYLAFGAILCAHLSRLAEETILWTSFEFRFARLSDAASTGSSIMPQKRNPDGAELVRGRTGRVLGHLVALLTTLKGLPLSYNKDLQEGGPAILDAAETVRGVIELSALSLSALSFDEERMAAALEGGFAEATEAADWLVQRGVPFREAHGVAAKLVGEAERRGLATLAELPDEALAAVHPLLTGEVKDSFAPSRALEARDVVGGTAPRRVRDEIRRMEEWLAERESGRRKAES